MNHREFLEVSEEITEHDLSEVERQLYVSFTSDFKEHYLKYNGGYPIKRSFQWPDGGKTRINHFFSVKYEGFSQLESVYDDLFITEQVLPIGYIPFATNDGGDFFCVSTLPESYNEVFFCDMHHYDEELVENYFTQISRSFKEFVDGLVND